MIDYKTIIGIPIHPAADLFPFLDEEALTNLENDIKLNGQAQPIITWRGAIVDGRNRYAACVRGGVKPKTKEVQFADDAEAVRFIISTNIHRRHLTESQRGMIANELAKLGHGQRQTGQGPDGGIQPSSLTQTQAAEAMQVSRDSVKKARVIAATDPVLAAEVKAGNRSLNSAHREIKRRSQPVPAKQADPPTDPSQAADSVIDKKEADAAQGFTKRMWSVWAAYQKLDATEQTAFREQQDKP